MIFFAGLHLQTAGNVNAIRTNGANRFRDIFNLEAAGQNNTVRGGSTARQLPIGGLTGATILAGASAVEQEGKDARVAIKSSKGEAGVDAKRFYDRERTGYTRSDVGSFVTMKLRGVDSNESAERIDGGGLGVDEDTEGFDFRGKLGANLRGISGDDAAEAFFVEIEAESVGPSIGGGLGVGKIGDAANFYANHCVSSLAW